MLDALGGVGTFFVFAFLNLVALGYFWHKVPETKGRSLQQIERDLAVEPRSPVRGARVRSSQPDLAESPP
jgi:Sugar (and other) transporter